MRPQSEASSRPSIRRAAALASLLVAGVLAPGPDVARANGTDRPGSIEARVLSLGAPVPGVAVQARSTGLPGTGQWVEDPEAAVDTTDARGIVRFPRLAPGRYHVTAHCGRLPGDRIAGNIATRVEVLPGATAHATLTLREGGRILGRTVLGERGLSGVVLQSEARGALPSDCPMLVARNPGPDGRFSIGKVPLGTDVHVTAVRRLGRGELEVTQRFNLARAETLSGTWSFPELDSASLGTATVGVRLDAGGAPDRGRLELQREGEGWRYRVGFDVTEADSLSVLPELPPGEYSVRAMATPGGKSWWNATTDTLVIAPGARRTKLLPGRIKR